MSRYNRKGNTTVKAKGPDGSPKHFAVSVDSKLAGIAQTKNRQMERMRRQHIRDYKAKLREAKKRIPLADRSKIKLEDL